MKTTKNGLVLAALSLAILGVTGCANLQPPAKPAPAPVPEEVHASVRTGRLLVSDYHPDTRTMYLWSGDPRPNAVHPMTCTKIQLSDTPVGAAKTSACD